MLNLGNLLFRKNSSVQSKQFVVLLTVQAMLLKGISHINLIDRERILVILKEVEKKYVSDF